MNISDIRQYLPATRVGNGIKSDINDSNRPKPARAETIAQSPIDKKKTSSTSELLQKKHEAGTLFLAQQIASSPATSEETSQSFILETNNGQVSLDLDRYFSNERNSGAIDLDEIPLLLPSAENIEALLQDASVKFKQLLKSYGIPESPNQITYDTYGKIRFPDDYPYANELKQALEENPGLDRELHTINALTSHFIAIQDRMPMMEKLSKANTQAEADEILEKYVFLFTKNSSNAEIALIFSDDGDLTVTADGKPYKAST